MNNIIKDDQKGFTLIEIMISIAIFAIGILAVGIMQGAAVKGNTHANRVTSATNLAQDKIEYLMGLPYNHLDLQDQDGDCVNADEGLDDIGFDNNKATQGDADYMDTHELYNVFWNISLNSPINNTKTIRVIVTCDSDQVFVWNQILNRRSYVSIDYIKMQ